MHLVRATAVLLCFASFSLGAELARLQTLTGETLKGELVSIDDKNVVLRKDVSTITTPVADVLQIDLERETSLGGLRYTDVELTDGSLLHCAKVVLKGKEIELTVVPELQIKVPLGAVSYLLNEAHDLKTRQEWDAFLARRGNRDLLAIRSEGVLNGLEGTFGDGDDKGETIEFELSSGRKVRPSLARVQGMVFFHKPGADRPETLCRVHDTHRNLLVASQLSLGETGLNLTTVAGVKVHYAGPQLLQRLDYSKGKLTYLSDLDPVTVEHSSDQDRLHPYRRNKNLDDGPITLAGKPYPKGLSVLARTVLVWNINGDYKEFKARLGIDDHILGDNEVQVTIEGDGKVLLTTVVRRRDETLYPEYGQLFGVAAPYGFVYHLPWTAWLKTVQVNQPIPVLLNVQGVKQLRITVSSEIDLNCHVDIADAKVSK